MKPPFAFSTARLTALTLVAAVAVSFSSAASAETQTKIVPAGKKRAVAAAAAAGTARPAGTPAAVSALDQAYGLLRDADHDYKGHRVRAMHAIEAAASELGAKLSGGGPGKEKQKTSDAQLHEAQSLLQQAIAGLAGKPHRHVNEALKELTIALNVK